MLGRCRRIPMHATALPTMVDAKEYARRTYSVHPDHSLGNSTVQRIRVKHADALTQRSRSDGWELMNGVDAARAAMRHTLDRSRSGSGSGVSSGDDGGPKTSCDDNLTRADGATFDIDMSKLRRAFLIVIL